MNEQQIKNLIDKQIETKLSSFNKPVVPTHIHNGIDALQVRSDDLIPYTTINDQNNSLFNTPYPTPSSVGEISLFDFSSYNENLLGNMYNWGIDIFQGNNDGAQVWTEINLADFYLDAYQTVPQVIGGGATEVIIFDTYSNIELPTGAYNATTGEFSVVNNPQGLPMNYNSLNKPLWYMVTASVGIAPTAGVAMGDYVNINVVVDGTAVAWNRFYFVPDSTGDYDILPIIATIDVLLTTPITSEIRIEIDNGSASDVNTNIAGIEQITFFKIKQLK